MMATKLVGGAEALRQDVEDVRTAGSRLFQRLADRAAYAGSEEYVELRSLMTALRLLSEKVDTVMASAAGDVSGAAPIGGAAQLSIKRGRRRGDDIRGRAGAAPAS